MSYNLPTNPTGSAIGRSISFNIALPGGGGGGNNVLWLPGQTFDQWKAAGGKYQSYAAPDGGGGYQPPILDYNFSSRPTTTGAAPAQPAPFDPSKFGLPSYMQGWSQYQPGTENYNQLYGIKNPANNTTITQTGTPVSVTGGGGTYQPGLPGDIGGTSDTINRLLREAQQRSNEGRIPGEAGLEGESSANIADALHGVLPADVVAQLQGYAAEHGVQTGMGRGPDNNAALLRALGTNSLALQGTGQDWLSKATARNPGAPIFDPSKMLLTPDQAARLNLEQQRLNLERSRGLGHGGGGGGGRSDQATQAARGEPLPIPPSPYQPSPYQAGPTQGGGVDQWGFLPGEDYPPDPNAGLDQWGFLPGEGYSDPNQFYEDLSASNNPAWSAQPGQAPQPDQNMLDPNAFINWMNPNYDFGYGG